MRQNFPEIVIFDYLCAKNDSLRSAGWLRVTAALWLAVAATTFAARSQAQAPRFAEVTAERLPAVAGRCMDADAGDADGDGDLDVALAMEFEPNVLLVNDGAGRFSNGSDRLPREVHDSEDVAFADFDGDGRDELLLCNRASGGVAAQSGGVLRLLSPGPE